MQSFSHIFLPYSLVPYHYVFLLPFPLFLLSHTPAASATQMLDQSCQLRGIHNSLTHFTESVHLDGGKDFNMQPTYRKRNSRVYLNVTQTLSSVVGSPVEQVYRKMAAMEAAEKVLCVLQYALTQLIVVVQRRFSDQVGNEPSVRKSIKRWYEGDGCLCIAKRPGRPGPSEERVQRAEESFQRSLRKTTNRAS